MRILWIDDEPIRYNKLSEALKGKDIEVIFAHGAEQIQYYMDRRDVGDMDFNLVLLDHDMPLMNGQEVCKEFLAERGMDVVIVSTNVDGTKDMIAILTESAVRVQWVPITYPDLLASEILRRYHHIKAIAGARKTASA